MPPLVSFAVNDEPPAHLDQFPANDVLDDPEIDTGEHKDENVSESLREDDGQEEVPE